MVIGLRGCEQHKSQWGHHIPMLLKVNYLTKYFGVSYNSLQKEICSILLPLLYCVIFTIIMM